MSRNRVLLGVLLLGAVATTLPAAAQLGFGNVELGEIKSQCVGVCFGTDCTQSGTIDTVTISPPFYVRGLRIADADDDFCANVTGVTTPVTLPVNVPAGDILVFDVDLLADALGPFTRALEVNGMSPTTAQTNVLPPGPCPPSATNLLCLENDRFTVRSFWRTQFGTRNFSQPVDLGVPVEDSGLFYFFNEDNWEILIKVLDGCPVNTRFWVFAAATTNVEYTITVTDTQEDVTRIYTNPLGTPAAPIQDTSAFATCP